MTRGRGGHTGGEEELRALGQDDDGLGWGAPGQPGARDGSRCGERGVTGSEEAGWGQPDRTRAPLHHSPPP